MMDDRELKAAEALAAWGTENTPEREKLAFLDGFDAAAARADATIVQLRTALRDAIAMLDTVGRAVAVVPAFHARVEQLRKALDGGDHGE